MNGLGAERRLEGERRLTAVARLLSVTRRRSREDGATSPGSPEGGQHRRTDRPGRSRGRALSPRALQATGASHPFVQARRKRAAAAELRQRANPGRKKQAAITSD